EPERMNSLLLSGIWKGETRRATARKPRSGYGRLSANRTLVPRSCWPNYTRVAMALRRVAIRRGFCWLLQQKKARPTPACGFAVWNPTVVSESYDPHTGDQKRPPRCRRPFGINDCGFVTRENP